MPKIPTTLTLKIYISTVACVVLGILAPGLILDFSDTYSHYSNHLHLSTQR